MIRNKILLKSIAVFLILETVFNTVAPTISWALTSGPTAPEATSFEPIDTTDIVNLATGDLAYNIPLLEVPGPSGGYPLGLSYHAGIQPNEDASWTGLGWTLNPGAIVRNVNGFADDHKQVENSTRFYWEGGRTDTYTVGVSVGIAGTPASVSAGLSFSQDTYQGRGVGGYLGVGFQFGDSPVGIGATIGTNGYGDSYASAGLSLSAPVAKSEKSAIGLSSGIGISTNFDKVNTYADGGISMSYGDKNRSIHTSLLGASISTGSGGFSGSGSVGGTNFIKNNNSGRVSSTSSGFTVPIPVWYGVSISLGYNYRRYWIDEMKNVKINGALNYPTPTDLNAIFSVHDFDDNAYDTYSLLDLTSSDGDPNKVLGGSFPEYDNYQVHAQGIFGAMRPYYFQKHLYKRNTYEDNGDGKEYKIIQYDLARNQTKDSKRAEFRFINDFSNRFEYTPDRIHYAPPYIDNNPQYHFDTGTNLKVGENAGGDYNTNLVQGSRSVLWFTNKEIVTKADRVKNAGFIDTRSSGFDRGNASATPKADQIGGYTITNESGVKYHFSLPAYSYSEYTYSESKTGASTFNEFYKREPYAYTWYLTAITGPDYVDRGENGTADGILNEYDWGYWVEFEYGKWSDQYVWRNPSENMTTDTDRSFQNFAEGKKEIYYLDAIHTKTHTALFFKDIRKDAKGSLYFLRNVSGQTFPSHTRKEEIVEGTKKGGFVPKHEHCSCDIQYRDKGELDYYAFPTSTMKLNSIVLIDNKSLSNISLPKSSGEVYSQRYSYTWSIDTDNSNPDPIQNCDFSPYSAENHLYYNVLDIYDYAKVQSALNGAALRSIDFTTSYALSPGTPNSFDNSLINTQNPSTTDSQYPTSGKLTLESISFKGKGGASLIPPMKFSYDLAKPLAGTSSLYTQSGDYLINVGQADVQAGDIVRLTNSSGAFYAAVKKQASGICTLKFPSGNTPATGFYTWEQTKNPGYNKDAYDIWGLYKSDYDASLNSISENVARQTSEVSGKGTDAWSLRSVQTSQGSEISFQYESDVYKNAMFSETNLMYIDNLVLDNQRTGYITVDLNHEVDLPSKFFVNQDIDLYAFLGTRIVGGNGKDFRAMVFALLRDHNIQRLDYTPDYAKSTVVSVGETSIVVYNQSLYKYLNDPGEFSEKKTDFLGGNIKLEKNQESIGGGLRLKEISVENDALGKSSVTKYSYQSGVSAYPPVITSSPHLNFPADEYYSSTGARKKYAGDFSVFLTYRFFDLLVKARELPSPGVLYQNVTVNEYHRENDVERKVPNHTSYEFEVFDPGMVDIAYKDDQPSGELSGKYDFISYHKITTRNVVLKDYTSRLGALNRITLYNDHGEKISETITNYLQNDAEKQLADSGYPESSTDFTLKANKEYFEPLLDSRFNSQGVIEETYTDARFAIPLYDVGTKYVLQGVVTKREQFPSIQIGQTTINYKTGITTTTSNVGFDYYSGQVVKSKSIDGHGNVYITETTPAYRQYTAMGLASSGGKNMLTQEAASYTYKVDPSHANSKTGLVSASVQTWSNQLPALQRGKQVSEASAQSGIWRKAANFTFIGSDNVTIPVDGFYPASGVTPFTAWNVNDPIPNGWQKTGAITLYDVNSHALEAIDVNGNYAATRISFDQSRVIATVANANYTEFAYSGAEDKASNEGYGSDVYMNGTPSNTAHTGSTSLSASPNARGFTYYMVAPQQRTYRVSVWSSQPAAAIKYKFDSNAETPAPVKNKGKAGNWYLLEADIAVATANISKIDIWCEAGVNATYFDDFRVRPGDAAMTSYVYNQWGELSHVLDNNNLYTEYRYDAIGRLIATYKESLKSNYGNQGIVKTGDVEYNYGSNNPYMLTINASGTGARGYIYPSGNISVQQGKDMRFEMRDKCSYNTLSSVWIDGKKIDINKPSVTLADGSVVSIQSSGKIVTFTNVQTAHTVRAEFASSSIKGVVVCNGYTDGNGNTCYDGSYKYAYYDVCGNQGSWFSASRLSQIPADLQSLAVGNCCQYNNGTVSGCSCKPGSTGIE
jgi:hypothetical protein